MAELVNILLDNKVTILGILIVGTLFLIYRGMRKSWPKEGGIPDFVELGEDEKTDEEILLEKMGIKPAPKEEREGAVDPKGGGRG